MVKKSLFLIFVFALIVSFPVTASAYEPIRTWGTLGDGEGQFRDPRGIAVDKDKGWVYVADLLNRRIQKFDLEGNYITEWGSEGDGPGEFGGPQGIAVDPNGTVFVADTPNHRIQYFDSDGNYINEWKKFEGGYVLINPVDVDVEGVIYQYVVGFSGSSLAPQYVTKGNWGEWKGDLEGFGIPSGNIAVDSSSLKNVYVVDPEYTRIKKFSSDGEYLMKWGRRGDGPSEFKRPSGITASENYVYVADTENHRVQVFDLYGHYITEFGSEGSGSGNFKYPSDVAVDADGNVYVADANNSRISVWAP